MKLLNFLLKDFSEDLNQKIMLYIEIIGIISLLLNVIILWSCKS